MKNRFDIYDKDEYSTLGLMRKFTTDIKEVEQKVDNKTDKTGDHKGSWQGLTRPTLSEEGMRATVEKHIADIEDLNSHIESIENNQPTSVLDFGADPTFEKDSTIAIQNAMNFSNETGRTIYFPKGKYKVEGTLYLRDYVSLKGDNTVITGINEFTGVDNKNNVLIVTFSNIVFQGINKKEDILAPVKIGIEGISFQHMGNVDASTLFYKIELRSSLITRNLFRGYATVFLGTMKYVTIIENNGFYDCRKYFLKAKNIQGLTDQKPSGITDSYIQNNYINGSVYASNMVGFDVHYVTYSSISNNFIDFFKIGFDISGGQGLTISNNDIQFCMRGINLATANNINISLNRFGLMVYETNKSNWDVRGTDISHWDKSWTGIYINNQNGRINILGNQGMTVDKLIRINSSGLRDINSQNNTTQSLDNLIEIISISKDANYEDDGERIFISETERINYSEQPFDLGSKTFKNHRIMYKGIPLINTGEGRFFKTYNGDILTEGGELFPTLTTSSTPTGWTINNNELVYNNNSSNWSHILTSDISVQPNTKYAVVSSCNITELYSTGFEVIFKNSENVQIGDKLAIYSNGESLVVTPPNTKYIQFDFTTNLSNTNVIFKKPSIRKLK